ncbi:penicillin acylase family protein [Ruegeria halocynthiae]|uniref:penicillin acylase family protein n=1 Tax=Ruegeria halocynthiae TaxID=985054 RepID=UPI00055FF01E|nr:penicillin acylase family protein [Ruegeria halocynthiae]
MKKFLKIGGSVIAVLAALGAGAYVYVTTPLSHPEMAELTSDKLKAEVKILRDAAGVPHVYGETAEDVMFGAGYVQAQDRMFQFEMIRRAGAGELSAILGEDLLEADVFARQTSYTDAQLQQVLDDMTPEHRGYLNAMLDGINTYVDQMQAEPGKYLPFEFNFLSVPVRHFTEADFIQALSVTGRLYGAVGGQELKNLQFLKEMQEKHGDFVGQQVFDDVMVLNDPDAYAFATEGTEVTIDLRPNYEVGQETITNDLTRIVDADRTGARAYQAAILSLGLTKGASRTTVVGPERSATGNLLMMHATADGYEVQLKGGGFDAAGMTISPVGTPIMGRSEDLGWVITTGERDTIDTYAEKLNPENKYQYWYNGAWRDMERRKEVIEIADGEPIEIEVASTVHGPIFGWDEDNNTAYSKRWSQWMSEGAGWGATLEFSRAKTIDDFRAALASAPMGNINVTVGDANGNYETRQMGNLPIRPEGVDPRLPAPGTGEYEWEGFVAFDDRPNLANPKRGYQVVWNNKPEADTVAGDFSRWGKHFRTYLPLALLESDDDVTIDDMKRFNQIIAGGWGSVELQTTSPDFFKPFWNEAAAKANDPRITEAVELMSNWNEMYHDLDGDGFYDDPGLLLYRTWREAAMDVIFEDDLGDWRTDFDADTYVKYGSSLLIRALEGDTAGLPPQYDFLNGKSRADVVTETLRETLRRLDAEYEGPLSERRQQAYYRYMGEVALEAPDEAMLPVPAGADGRATGYAGAGVDLGHLPAAVKHNGAPDWMVIMEIGADKPALETLTPAGGQSWFINKWARASKHLNDQTHRHRDFDFKTIEMDDDAVQAVSESTLILRPAN